MTMPYRPCVVGVFWDKEKNQVLLGRRKKIPSWQFPQGGVNEGESFQQALFREMHEEIGCQHFLIIGECPTLLRYDFPQDMQTKIAQKYKGQEQKWFLCQLQKNEQPDLAKAQDDEFSALKWEPPEVAIQEVISWKKQVYLQALNNFGLLTKKKD